MYTLEELQAKTFKELKEIGWQLNALPAGDRRCRQNWIDALVGVNPPLLALLEVSPGVECAQEPIAQAAETSPSFVEQVPTERFDVEEFRQEHAAEIESYFKSFTEADRPPNRGDNGRGRLESEAKMSQSAIAPAAKFTPGIELDPSRAKHQWITFSARFLALYPPYFGEVNYKADATGQLNLLEPDIEDEPPDPDDFESLDAFREAMARWDAEHCEPSSEHCEPSSEHCEPSSEHCEPSSEHCEPLEISLSSFCEWAPCPEEWFLPDTNETNETVSCTLELSLPPIESSNTSDFSIPVFGGFADRTNGNSSDEPPTSGVGARLPKPKPPSFPPMAVVAGDRSSIKQFARSATLLSGRAPPGGDAM